MKWLRIPRDAGWKDCLLTMEEVRKLQKDAFIERIKLMSALKNLVKDLKVELTETERLAVFHGVAPTYSDLAGDYCKDQLQAKAKQAESAKAATSAG